MSCASPLTAAPALGMARKTVSIVFCDVVGSTPMGDELDPETVRRVMTRFFDEMRSVLERHGGTVEKYIGDAVMAVFGIPRLHEDDALRRRAAADMRCIDLTQRRPGAHGRRLHHHANRREHRRGLRLWFPFGPGRRRRRREPGCPTAAGSSPREILLGRETYELVRDSVSVDEGSRWSSKGSACRSPYRLIDITAFGERPNRANPPWWVALMRSDGCAKRSTSRSRSEPAPHGHGNSRGGQVTARERIRHRHRGRSGHDRGRCLPYGDGITFWPIAEAVRELAGIDLDDPLEIARSKLEALLRGAEDSGLLFDRVAAAIGLADTTVGMQETFWAIRRLLEQVARERPLVVTLDDLQWAEPALLDPRVPPALLPGRPDLVLCLARSDLLEERSGWATRLPNATILHLQPLAAEEIGMLIDELFEGGDLSAALRGRISDVGSGNPLFVVEMFKMLRDDGVLEAQGADAGGSTREAALATVPPTINALVGARLDRLTAEERAAIHGGAVIGKIFSWAAVVDLVPDELRSRVGPILQSLVRRELITPTTPARSARMRSASITSSSRRGRIARPQGAAGRPPRAFRRLARADHRRPDRRERRDPRVPPRAGGALSRGARAFRRPGRWPDRACQRDARLGRSTSAGARISPRPRACCCWLRPPPGRRPRRPWPRSSVRC